MQSIEEPKGRTSHGSIDPGHYPADPSRGQQGNQAGKDDGSAAIEGEDDHLKEDQKQAPPSAEVGEDDTEDEMEEARKHADPSRGDKVLDGGDRVSTEEGGNLQE